MVIIFFAIAFVALLTLITCCVTCLCKHCNPRRPTSSARYTFDVDTKENSEGGIGNNFIHHQDMDVFVNDGNLDTKDGVIIIQMQNINLTTEV